MIDPVNWWVYIVRCADGTLYTGVTTDLERRIEEHNGTGLAARYTRGRQPVVLAYTEEAADRGAALKREASLKKLPKAAKERLIKA